MGYRIAGHVSLKQNLTGVATESHLARCVRQLFAQVRPRRVIETGTYHGTGSTTIIASALRDAGIGDATFFSIEVNPHNYRKSLANLAKQNLAVSVLNGLSVPRQLLPSREQIEQHYVREVEADGIFVDHEEAQRAMLYHKETDYPDAPDDLLGRCLKNFNCRPDFVLLDSGGHMGHVEFRYVLPLIKAPCHIALDDIYHVKHHRSFQELGDDPRFELVAVSEEKFGFCIAKFMPGAPKEPRP
jgi:cephalosporin hydroxylase